MRSLFPGICPRCGVFFPIGTEIVRRKETFIHKSCAPGSDDE